MGSRPQKPVAEFFYSHIVLSPQLAIFYFTELFLFFSVSFMRQMTDYIYKDDAKGAKKMTMKRRLAIDFIMIMFGTMVLCFLFGL